MNDLPSDVSAENEPPVRPMLPLQRHVLGRQHVEKRREPITAVIESIQAEAAPPSPDSPAAESAEEMAEEILPYAAPRSTAYARREVDPLFSYLFLISLGIGLSTFEPTIRFVFLWTLMGSVAVMGYLLGSVEQAGEAKVEDVLWGLILGFLSSFPFLLVFGTALKTVSERMFDVPNTPPQIMDTWVFMAVAFIMPATETLFFRGAIQGVRGLFFTAVLATIWLGVLFFPYMSLGGREAIAVILVMVFGLLNFMFSYMRHRNGLVGAWLCQIISYTLLWFFPRLLF